MRKKLVAVGTAIGVAAISLMSATPASAAPVVDISCVSSVFSLSPSNVTAGVGDTITLRNTYPGTRTISALNGVSGPSTIAGNGSANYSVTSASGGSIRVEDNDLLSGCNTQSATLTVNAGGGGSSADSSSGPEAAMQQFGKPDSMTCNEAQPEGLNWSGVPSGGWGESWAQWMNGGNGGTVCTRTLSYVGSGWTVN